ncbi:Uncharacterised protein [Candidatus Bartonella washoeensis]|uniref:Uncharacterized protein n=2 Tax=Candidatus Bartonella washoeensis TaxID=186739 RepID=J0Z6B4_9HYPH|nr:hypothetical protein MCQ_00057 [Bartonella washoeensis Sb944nv]EJF83183.1 hypothetical protein MCW_01477 [Bartonella washoeensis 085-0475]SPU27798.1 Uncharacterised protein [Bartonella washoeensis]
MQNKIRLNTKKAAFLSLIIAAVKQTSTNTND